MGLTGGIYLMLNVSRSSKPPPRIYLSAALIKSVILTGGYDRRNNYNRVTSSAGTEAGRGASDLATG
jgi:hypothetical protein